MSTAAVYAFRTALAETVPSSSDLEEEILVQVEALLRREATTQRQQGSTAGAASLDQLANAVAAPFDPAVKATTL